MRRIIIAAFALTGTAAGGWWMVRPGAIAVHSIGQTAIAKKGDFNIAITEQGSFTAKQSVKLQFRPEVMGEQPTIIRVVDAGSLVKKDDVLMEFDPAPVERMLAQAEIDLQAGENDLLQVTTDMRIAEENNKLNLEKAKLDLDFDRRNLKKWIEIEGPKQLEEQQARVLELENNLAKLQANLQALQKMKEEDLVSEAEVRQAKLDVEKAARDLNFQKMAVKLLKDYDQPLDLKRRQDAVQRSASLLEGNERAAEAVMASKKSSVLRNQNSLQQKREHLEKVRRDRDRLTIKAPVDGMVLYGDSDQHWGDNIKIAAGEKVWAHHTLLTIPDLSAFTVKLSIGEADINKVRAGMVSIVKPDALPDVSFQASVKSVSNVVSQNQWWAPDASGKFEVVLDLVGADSRIKPGMKCKVDIAVESVAQVLCVPVDAVFEKEGKTFCHVVSGGGAAPQAVRTGRANADVVEILDGLSDGSTVALFDPSKE